MASGPVLLSGASPFPDCAVDPDPPPLFDGPDHELELEPTVAVNPANPTNVVAAWLQGENLGVVAASSFDSGKTWQRTVVPEITSCSGGVLDIAFNPNLSIGPDGTAYLVTMASGGYFPDPRGALTRVMVSRSSDGGRSWKTTAITGGDADNDFPTIAAEPDQPGAAVAVWAKKAPPASDVTMFSRTTDGGTTWSIPRVAATTDPDRLALNQVAALGDGSFVIGRFDFPLSGATSSQKELRLFRSSDKGETWSPTASFPDVDSPSIATTGDRDLHVALTVPVGDRREATVYSSDDGGVTFGAGRSVPSWPGNNMGLSLAADDERNLAIATWDGFPTGQLRLYREHDGSGDWKTVTIGSETSLPPVGGYLRPELDALPRGFALVAPFGSPQAELGPTDIFFSRLWTSRALRSR